MPNPNSGFQLAAPSPGSGGSIPETIERTIASGYAEAQGALLVVNGSDEFEACAADANVIAAVALTPGGADTSGFNILARKEFPPLKMQGIRIANGVKFIAAYVGDLPAAPGGEYGFIRDSDGEYKVDFNEVVNVCLKYLGVVDFRPDLSAANEGLVEIVFLDSVIQSL